MAQSLPATGGRNRSLTRTHQLQYWHNQVADLHAATPTVKINQAGAAATMAGPMGVGERWDVQNVHVQTSTGLAVPCTAQVWRSVAGITVNLLMQTINGGLDDLGIVSPVLTAGEQIAVIWSGADPDDSAWAVIRGTKYVLSQEGGQV
jgi:hypothetical protein